MDTMDENIIAALIEHIGANLPEALLGQLIEPEPDFGVSVVSRGQNSQPATVMRFRVGDQRVQLELRLVDRYRRASAA